jgi:hypothetical protein
MSFKGVNNKIFKVAYHFQLQLFFLNVWSFASDITYRIEVNDGRDGNFYNHADWIGPGLVK